MSPQPFSNRKRLQFWFSSALFMLAAAFLHAEVIVDGQATGSGQDGYTTLHTQAQESGYGSGNVLASLRYVQTGNTLNLFIAGRATNNAIIVFIDAKPGGVNNITPDLIATQPGGEQDFINRLAVSETEGMTFENGFQPETAIRIFGDEVAGTKHAYVNRFDLVAGTQVYAGDSHSSLLSEGPIRNMKSDWRDVGDNNGTNGYDTHAYGVEMALNLSALGVGGGSQIVKVSVIMVSSITYDPVNGDFFEGSNQTLGSLGTISYSGMGTSVSSFDFQEEPEDQTLSIPVIGLDPEGDADFDGLLNGVETGTGVFINAWNTGTNPESNDTDGDGYFDGAEVSGSALGYVSNPNFKNNPDMAVPGDFNGWQTNSPATAMQQESTNLIGQYRWKLDYKFLANQLGGKKYKFTSGGSWAITWGAKDPPTNIAVVQGSNDILCTVSASGFHRFFFDQKTLEYSFSRTPFASSTEFLTAYGLVPGLDSDGDGVLNQNEFRFNTDPTNADTDGDGDSDSIDFFPLIPRSALAGYDGWVAGLAPSDRARNADPDGDGLSNVQEFLFGSSPAFSTGTQTPMARSGGNLVIRWLQRTTDSTYRLEESFSLAENPWPVSAVSVTTDANQTNVPIGYIRKSATIPTNSTHRFFRVFGQE